jgi:hypothetical protein
MTASGERMMITAIPSPSFLKLRRFQLKTKGDRAQSKLGRPGFKPSLKGAPLLLEA